MNQTIFLVAKYIQWKHLKFFFWRLFQTKTTKIKKGQFVVLPRTNFVQFFSENNLCVGCKNRISSWTFEHAILVSSGWQRNRWEYLMLVVPDAHRTIHGKNSPKTFCFISFNKWIKDTFFIVSQAIVYQRFLFSQW